MSKRHVAVVYHTITGTTGQLASAISEGINSISDIEAVEYGIEGAEIVEGRFVNEQALEIVTNVDAVIFGVENLRQSDGVAARPSHRSYF